MPYSWPEFEPWIHGVGNGSYYYPHMGHFIFPLSQI